MKMRNFWLIIIVGILLRIFLAFATFHPDIEALNAGARLISQGSILDLYEYSSEKVIFNYPPLIYWFLGFANFLIGDNLALLKLFYLPFDLALGFLLFKIVDVKKSTLALGIWVFNPVNLYATYMMGQFDIIPTFFSVLSIYFALRNKLNWAALALGFGIAFKLYPLFLVFPLIILGKGIWTKVKLLCLVSLPYVPSVLPYLSSAGFRSHALLANQSSKSLYANIPVSGGESILLFPAFLLFFYLFLWNRTEYSASLWKVYLIPLLLFFIFTHYHPQWLIWVTPFLVLDLINEKFKNLVPIIIVFVSWYLSLFTFDPSLTVGLFAPLFPALANAQSLWTILNLNLDYNFTRSVIQTIFAASAAFIIFRNFHKIENA